MGRRNKHVNHTKFGAGGKQQEYAELRTAYEANRCRMCGKVVPFNARLCSGCEELMQLAGEVENSWQPERVEERLA